jgi:hypothetical protein
MRQKADHTLATLHHQVLGASGVGFGLQRSSAPAEMEHPMRSGSRGLRTAGYWMFNSSYSDKSACVPASTVDAVLTR